MRIIAVEKEIEGKDWSNAEDILKKEAEHVYMLKEKKIIEDIYFDQNKCAILMLECKDEKEAQQILSELPLVTHQYIRFEIHALSPYTGFDRLV